MGGTGTYRMGVKYPDIFAAIHAHAGFADFKGPCGNFCRGLDKKLIGSAKQSLNTKGARRKSLSSA